MLILYAALSGCLSCTETLWDFKADLDAQDEVKWTFVECLVREIVFFRLEGGLLDQFYLIYKCLCSRTGPPL